MAWTHQINRFSDHVEVRKVLDEFGIPTDYICLNAVAIGVPAENPKSKEHTKEIAIVS